ncbi:hypothetical protein Tco_0001678 [Tanacetum coccineum]
MVRDFTDVFLEDLLGLPPQRQVEFRIDFVHEVTPVEWSKVYAKFLPMGEVLVARSTLPGSLVVQPEWLFHYGSSKIEEVKNWKAPVTTSESDSFLGLAGNAKLLVDNAIEEEKERVKLNVRFNSGERACWKSNMVRSTDGEEGWMRVLYFYGRYEVKAAMSKTFGVACKTALRYLVNCVDESPWILLLIAGDWNSGGQYLIFVDEFTLVLADAAKSVSDAIRDLSNEKLEAAMGFVKSAYADKGASGRNLRLEMFCGCKVSALEWAGCRFGE